MNSLQIDQAPSDNKRGIPSTLKAKRTHMRRLFNSWLKRPTDSASQQALHNVMVDYELGARMRALFPLAIHAV